MFLIEYVCGNYSFSEKEANGIIMAGKVMVNNEVCTSAKYKLKKDDVVEVKYKAKQFVTRSGFKLQKAIETFAVPVQGKICLDIGASEGGFTDCLLQHGAKKVYAVDVAYGILNWKVRSDERVVPIERFNARHLCFDTIGEHVDIATADVSFISIRKILPNVKDILKQDGIIISLYKPQFELPPQMLGKNGNVNDPLQAAAHILETVEFFKKQGIFVREITFSPIKGNSGNTEFLLLGDTNVDIRSVISEQNITECVLSAYGTGHDNN